ncbi:MAG: YraN family protein [Armatimonadota bacterium]|nr:YraN family protein [Armatimonadota bacterium]
MLRLRQQRGQAGEDAAARFLQARGYRIIARNWRPGKESSGALRGEVDCIAWHGQILCFVEVKARTSNERGAPQEAVTSAKQRQLSRLANAYLSIHRLADTPCRFDVVEVWLSPDNATQPRVALHQNAFDYCEGPRRGSQIF